MNPLEMATTEELLSEISRRHHACAFIGMPLIGNTSAISRTSYQVNGDSMEVLGLISLLNRIIGDDIVNAVATEIEDGEA